MPSEFSPSGPATNLTFVATWTAQSPDATKLIFAVLYGNNLVANADGESPLTLSVASLPNGTYRIHVAPDLPVHAMLNQEVAWAVTYQTLG